MSVLTRTMVVSQWALRMVSGSSILTLSRTPSSEVTHCWIHISIEFDGGIGIVELLYRTNIIALVGGGDKPKWPTNKVMLWDDSAMKVIGEFNFKTEVKAVKLRKEK
jgi:hypothetical protein